MDSGRELWKHGIAVDEEEVKEADEVDEKEWQTRTCQRWTGSLQTWFLAWRLGKCGVSLTMQSAIEQFADKPGANGRSRGGDEEEARMRRWTHIKSNSLHLIDSQRG